MKGLVHHWREEGAHGLFLIHSSVTYLLCELVQVTCSLMLELIYKMGIIKVKVKI